MGWGMGEVHSSVQQAISSPHQTWKIMYTWKKGLKIKIDKEIVN